MTLGKKIQALESKFMQLGIFKGGGLFGSIEAKSMFVVEIKANQFEEGNLEELSVNITIDKSKETTLDSHGVLNHKGRICFPRVDDLI